MSGKGVVNEEDGDESPAFSSEEDEACFAEEYTRPAHFPSEYWHIQRLIKYMRTGNQTAAIISLAGLKDIDLTTEINQLSIKDISGLEVVINILETDESKCKIGALYVLRAITSSYDGRKSLANLGGVPLLIETLKDQSRELQILAAETIANVARIRKARMIVRKCNGIPYIVDLLDVSQKALITPLDELTSDEQELVEVARAGALALWSLSKSTRNREAMKKAGVVKLLSRLLKSIHPDVIVPIVGTIQQCASEADYQLAIQTEGMIAELVRHLTSPSIELKTLCASAIFKCAEDEKTRQQVRQHGGLDELVSLAKDIDLRVDKDLLAAVTGAIWKCAINPENIRRLDDLFTVRILVQLLEDENEEVLTNVVGGLAECCKSVGNRETLRKCGGIQPLVQLLRWTNQPLLENVASVLGEVAQEEESFQLIESMDGVRLVWSLLKNPSPRVQANAAWALCPMIQNAKDSGEMVRSLVGALAKTVSLLKSTDAQVLAGVCAAISKVAEDKVNLAIMTDFDVVPMLCHLVPTRDDRLREQLASAIASCCGHGNNAYKFGRLGAINPLVDYMGGDDKAVHRTTARALHMLSTDPDNCIALHQSGVVYYLLVYIGSSDKLLQESSAGCLANLRRLALSAETFKINQSKLRN